MVIYIIIGVFFVILGVYTGVHSDFIHQLFCGICLAWVGMVLGFFVIWCISKPATTYYLEAEPLAYNYETNITYFTSTEGQFKAEGIYPENTYLLTMDNNGTSDDKEDDIVLVVWEPSEGEIG